MKQKSQTKKQFKLRIPKISSIIWRFFVILIILSLVLTAVLTIVSFFTPATPQLTQDQLQQQLQQLTITIAPPTTTTSITLTPTK